jgi:kynurenine formamidase
MTAIADPHSSLQFYELSHRWGYNSPTMPGLEDVRVHRGVYHAKHGVMTQTWKATMHVSTHVNAPLYLIPNAPAVGDLSVEKFFGTGVVLDIPKGKWELITEKDLEAATPKVEADDIVLIITGWHRKYADSKEYFGYAPGLSSMGPHRNGPQIKYLLPEYKKATGREAIADFPDWNPAHKHLLSKGIPTISNVGGDVDDLLGKRCTFHAQPWEWREGEACVIRLAAMLDPSGAYRIESGKNS